MNLYFGGSNTYCANFQIGTIINNFKSYKVYEVDINFDNAHEEWCKNKIKGKNGTYKYK